MGKIIAKLKFIGPITRSTVGKEVVDPKVESINDTLHWIWSFQLQYDRLLESFQHEINLIGRSDGNNRKAFSRTTFDEHILLVAGRNLERAIKRLKKYYSDIIIEPDFLKRLRLLGNIYEHWDQHRDEFRLPSAKQTHSLRVCLKKFPGKNPWSVSYGENGLVLGGVIKLKELLDSLNELEKTLLSLEKKYNRRSIVTSDAKGE